MTRSICTLLLLAGLLMALSQCSKKTDTYISASINDYYPLQTGKYIIYQLDSTVYVNFGQTKEIRGNIIKDVVDAQITDNPGRPSFRILRYVRSLSDTTQWIHHSTYMVTPLDKSLELVEDNMRFIKLVLPVTNDYTWNGNRYLIEDVFPEFGFNSTAHSSLASWDYVYQNVNNSASVNGFRFDSTITVTCSITDSTGFPPVTKNAPAFKTVWEEKYAKGIGLISKQVSLQEFQPTSASYPDGYYSGFALKQTIIGHN